MTGPLIGAVLCGGQSSRFGTDKALADAGGTAMALRVATALRDAGADPVVAVGGAAGGRLGLPTVADRYPGQGPLEGLASVLRWAKTGLVVVAPCDLPLLRGEHLRQLIDAATDERAAVATVDGGPQPSLACWPASWAPAIRALVDQGDRAWRAALSVGPWTGVPVSASVMADADSPTELATLLRNDVVDQKDREPGSY